MLAIEFTLNGIPVTAAVDAGDLLADVLRDKLGMIGIKIGCGEGECGACTVLLDGLPVNSCLVPAFQVAGRSVETVEAVAPEVTGPLNRTGTAQCGACSPGIVVMTRWLREHPEVLQDATLRQFMSGNLCRCTGYDSVISGVASVLDPKETAGGEGTSA